VSDTIATVAGLPLHDYLEAEAFVKDMFLAYGVPMPDCTVPDVCRILHQIHWAMTRWATVQADTVPFDHPKLARYRTYLRVVDNFFWHYLGALPWDERPDFPWPTL